ncbi:hypothetical protein GGX14DRAFT_559042 [Mycena pura]|uniref:Uncharacterized protein n=1 Tax=Mycena pura TaxID=153505 RepID=A0AAD6VSQ2_9AGAR|nr:hypothetical protein GGX14DRAFT_559042 [Mycena pura]
MHAASASWKPKERRKGQIGGSSKDECFSWSSYPRASRGAETGFREWDDDDCDGFQDRFTCCATPTPAPDFNACDEWRAEWGNPAWRAGWPHDPRGRTHSPRSWQRVMPLLLLFVCAPFRYAAAPLLRAVLADAGAGVGPRAGRTAVCAAGTTAVLRAHTGGYMPPHVAQRQERGGAVARGRCGIQGRRRRASTRRTLPPPAVIVLLPKFNNPSTLPLGIVVATGWFAQKLAWDYGAGSWEWGRQRGTDSVFCDWQRT